MKKKKIVIGTLIVAIGLGAALFNVLSKKGGDVLELYGNVDQRQVELAFLDSERVEAVLVEERAVVEKGQELASWRRGASRTP